DFTLKRSTAFMLTFLKTGNEMPLLIPRFIVDYWYVPLTWLALTVFAWYLYSFTETGQNKPAIITGNKLKNRSYQVVVFVILFFLTLVGARGGIQPKPLAILHASRYSSAKDAPLVLNTPFTVMRTLKYKSFEIKEYYPLEKCQKIYPTLHRYNYPDSSFRKINVVVIVLESFSREYSGYLNGYKGYTPFLDSLMQHSLVFTHAFSNGLRSIDAIPCLVSGIPDLMENPFLFSVYNTDNIGGFATILKEKGYRTAFFHGGNNGTMSFDSFAKMAGFDAYYGHTEYNNEEDDSEKNYDGYWGIYDHAFLQYFARKLNSFNQPFFALEFTLSSHNPYKVPYQYREKFPETVVKIHRVVQYSDFSLKRFFQTASTMPWFKNTLFVISADHPGHSISVSENNKLKDDRQKLNEYQLDYYKNTVGSYAIPVLFYFPGDSLQGIISTTFQQSDVLPTVLDYMGYNQPFIAFGNSIFNDSVSHVAFEYINGNYQIMKGDYSLLFNGDTAVSLYNSKEDPEHEVNLISEKREIANELEMQIKAIIQQFNYRLVNNKLVP
ncbi:MAG: sulfatase-like hydrolase/transferase, partial [Chlorobi bacterium]|nr:sulfatase-like hydrolase/transferase [Chlorobiota bacterium]